MDNFLNNLGLILSVLGFITYMHSRVVAHLKDKESKKIYISIFSINTHEEKYIFLLRLSINWLKDIIANPHKLFSFSLGCVCASLLLTWLFTGDLMYAPLERAADIESKNKFLIFIGIVIFCLWDFLKAEISGFMIKHLGGIGSKAETASYIWIASILFYIIYQDNWDSNRILLFTLAILGSTIVAYSRPSMAISLFASQILILWAIFENLLTHDTLSILFLAAGLIVSLSGKKALKGFYSAFILVNFVVIIKLATTNLVPNLPEKEIELKEIELYLMQFSTLAILPLLNFAALRMLIACYIKMVGSLLVNKSYLRHSLYFIISLFVTFVGSIVLLIFLYSHLSTIYWLQDINIEKMNRAFIGFISDPTGLSSIWLSGIFISIYIPLFGLFGFAILSLLLSYSSPLRLKKLKLPLLTDKVIAEHLAGKIGWYILGFFTLLVTLFSILILYFLNIAQIPLILFEHISKLVLF